MHAWHRTTTRVLHVEEELLCVRYNTGWFRIRARLQHQLSGPLDSGIWRVAMVQGSLFCVLEYVCGSRGHRLLRTWTPPLAHPGLRPQFFTKGRPAWPMQYPEFHRMRYRSIAPAGRAACLCLAPPHPHLDHVLSLAHISVACTPHGLCASSPLHLRRTRCDAPQSDCSVTPPAAAQERSVEVQMFCTTVQEPAVSFKIVEPRTCVYTLVVNSHLVCNLPQPMEQT